jgi:hypothetical protein
MISDIEPISSFECALEVRSSKNLLQPPLGGAATAAIASPAA